MLNGNVEIELSDGSTRKISQLCIDNSVLSENGTVKIVNVIMGWENSMIVVTTCGGITIEMTKNHPVFTKNGCIFANELKEGDSLCIESGYDEVKKIIVTDGQFDVFDIVLEDGQDYYANKIWVGNYNMESYLISKKRANEYAKNDSVSDAFLKELEALKQISK